MLCRSRTQICRSTNSRYRWSTSTSEGSWPRVSPDMWTLLSSLSVFSFLSFLIGLYSTSQSEPGGSVVKHETRIREAPGSNPGPVKLTDFNQLSFMFPKTYTGALHVCAFPHDRFPILLRPFRSNSSDLSLWKHASHSNLKQSQGAVEQTPEIKGKWSEKSRM